VIDNKVTITIEDRGGHVIVDINGGIRDVAMLSGLASLVHTVLVDTKTPLSTFMTDVLKSGDDTEVSGSVTNYPHINPEGGSPDENL
jgi:hypothetical protein